ncbi:MAG: hypothetical protein KC910_31070 [Candidatus Eremiobacteraeota bacterium]|nr:hypothetical protein [Candidatus Eremiobacteraeota bacterium]
MEKILDRILGFAGIALLVAVLLAWFVTPILFGSTASEGDAPAIVSGRKPGVEESRRQLPGSVVKVASRKPGGKPRAKPDDPPIPNRKPSQPVAEASPTPAPVPVRESPGPLALPERRPTRPPSRPPVEPPPALPEGKVPTLAWVLDDLNAYQEPGLNRPIVSHLQAGDQVRFIEARDDWDRVVLEGRGEAWLPANHLAFERPKIAGPSASQSVVESLQHYFQALDQRDFPAAYSMLASARQQEWPYENFTSNYSSLSGAECRVERIESQSPAEALVSVRVRLNDFEGQRVYAGTASLVNEGGRWLIRSLALRPEAAAVE